MHNQNLDKDTIHLWFCSPDEIRDAKLLQGYRQILNDEENQRYTQFHFDKDRHPFLIAKALVRTVLSQYLPLTPAECLFEKNQYGRPCLKPGQMDGSLHFNLSYSKGLLVLAVMRDWQIAVDIENTQIQFEFTEIAKDFFSSAEYQIIKNLSEQQQKSRFFDFWTLKEAYIKARGMGLSLSLKQFSFDLSKQQQIHIAFANGIQDQAERWRFALLYPSDRHTCAFAFKAAYSQPEYQWQAFKTVPLVKTVSMSLVLART